jgi:trimeric autotransporter adhesin
MRVRTFEVGQALSPAMGSLQRMAAFAIELVSVAGLSFAQQYTISTVAGGAPPSTPVPATSISIGQPQRVTVDAAGNIYFTSLNCVFKVDGSGTLTRIAGNSRPGYSGDGGAATQAQLHAPAGLATDASGDIFIADTANNVVREVTPDGKIQTVAGNGTQGYSGDFGPATQAQLHSPSGVAVDGSGNLYIADSGNNAIREVTTDGNISPFAGNGLASYYGDTSTSTPTPPPQAGLDDPQDVAVGPNGVIYIADTGNSFIRAVANGAINFVAGSGSVGFAGDGGSATATTTNTGPGVALYGPRAIAFDSAGNYYLADSGNGRIRKVNTKGIITTVAGNGTFAFAGDGSAATAANLSQPSGVALDSQGNIYIADTLNARIRKVSSSGTITTVAGNGLLSYSGDGGAATGAQLNGPLGIAADNSGNLFIADSQNGVVRIIKNGAIASVGGSTLLIPRSVATDAAGNAYVADVQDNRVRKIGTDGTVTTYAGNGTNGFAGDGGPAANAQLSSPAAVAVDGAGNLYIADLGNLRIRKVSTNGNISTVAGNGSQGYSGDGGPAINANLNAPLGVAVDPYGNLYVVDSASHVIREVTLDGNINTIAGTGEPGFTGDGGPAASAQLASPTGIAADPFGNIFFVDGTTRIREINTGGIIATVAGNGSSGYSGDGGMANLAQFNSPSAVWAGAAGNLYVADTGNNAVRLLQPAGSGVTVGAVVNAASNQNGALAPGEIVALYGSGLGPPQLQMYQLDASGRLTKTLAGTTVLFGNQPAPVIYASPAQTSVVVPFGVTGQSVQVVVQSQNQTAAPMTMPVAAAAPGLFTADASGHGQAAALNQNLQPNSAANPAARGSLLSLFATGAGQMSPSATDGAFNGVSPPSMPILQPVAVTIGGQQATVSAAIGAPGQVAGMLEITVRVPTGIQPGNAVPVTLQIGGASAQSGVTVAIGQ